MKTGFIIINYNDFESTKKLIDNIASYKVIDRIIVIDNHSTDDSAKLLKKIKNNKLKIVISKENGGYSKAINLGCKTIINDLGKCHIIISNADIIINSEDDIKRLISKLDNKKVGVVAPVIFEHGNLNRGWKQPKPWQEVLLNIPYIHRWLRKKFLYYNQEYYKKKSSPVDVVSGCFFIVDSTTIEKINYLDESVFLYYEENILSKKLKDIDKICIIDNETKIIHNHSVTIDKSINKLNKYRIQKKSQYYFEKNYNNASCFCLLMIKATSKITEKILWLVYKIRDLK